MSAGYRIDLLQNGAKIAEIGDYISLTYTRQVNAPGLLEFAMPAGSPASALIATDLEARVYRSNPQMGLAWTLDFDGIIRRVEWDYRDAESLTVRAEGILGLLARRIVAWYAEMANRSTWDAKPAETILKDLVDYNAGPNATTAAGRIRGGVISGVSVQADQGRGSSLSYSCAYGNLLESLQGVAAIGGGDFDLVPVPGGYEFRFYPGQLGVDRRATLLFALSRTNISNVQRVTDTGPWRTVAIAAGGGWESARDVNIVYSGDHDAAHDYEVFVDARSSAGPEDSARAALLKARISDGIAFDVVQLPSCYYGVHYGLGDLARASYRGLDLDVKLTEATISYKDGAEAIGIKMEAV